MFLVNKDVRVRLPKNITEDLLPSSQGRIYNSTGTDEAGHDYQGNDHQGYSSNYDYYDSDRRDSIDYDRRYSYVSNATANEEGYQVGGSVLAVQHWGLIGIILH